MLSLHVRVTGVGVDTWVDLTSRCHRAFGGGGLRFSTNQHGFASLEAPLVRMTLQEAFAAYEWTGTPYVLVRDQHAATVWEGRLEDIAIVDGGIAVQALGKHREMYNELYTAMWSTTILDDWKQVTVDNLAAARPEKYEFDTNNRLYIALKKGEEYSNATHDGSFTYAIPHRSTRGLQKFACSYDMKLPNNWIFRVMTYTDAWGSASTINTVTANGSAQSGTLDLSLSGADRVVVNIRNNSGSATTVTDETGDLYLSLTAVRLKTTTSTAVYASEIAGALLPTGAVVEATAADLRNQTYEDMRPGAILDRLASLGAYEWGAYENFYFREKYARREWFVDVAGPLEVQRSLENVRNSVYTVYRNAGGTTRRTTTATDTASYTRYGYYRTEALNVQTTNATEAETHRNVYLNDNKRRQDRANIETARIYDARGSQWPLWAVRAGDSVTMRNLSPALSVDIDRIRTFRVAETEYDAEANRLTLSAEEPTPTLVTLVARRGAGL